jgi:hypothetical protein
MAGDPNEPLDFDQLLDALIRKERAAERHPRSYADRDANALRVELDSRIRALTYLAPIGPQAIRDVLDGRTRFAKADIESPKEPTDHA